MSASKAGVARRLIRLGFSSSGFGTLGIVQHCYKLLELLLINAEMNA